MSENVVTDNTGYVSYKLQKAREERRLKIKPMYRQVKIRKEILILVPKWIITFKAAQINYRRCMMATSGKVIVDEIA